jgi:hypothetical protein
MQCNYSSAYPDFSIQLNVSALLMEISRQFNPRYTANLMPHTAHILQFTRCERWSRPYTKYLQLRIFRPQYSTERICAAIGDITTIQCALYCKLGANYSAHPPVYAIWNVIRTYTMQFQLHIFRLQYSIHRIYAAIRDNRTLQCPLYCKFGAKYNANPPVYTICTMVPDIYKVFTAPHSQSTIFNWTWLRSY